MITFTDRIKLEQEYYEWIEKAGKENNVRIVDCPATVIAFLDQKGIFQQEETRKAAEKDRDYWINEFNELEERFLKHRSMLKAIESSEELKHDNFGVVDFKRLLKQFGVKL